MEREQIKLEKDKLRIEKERLRALEREAKLVKLKGRLSQDVDQAVMNPVISPLAGEALPRILYCIPVFFAVTLFSRFSRLDLCSRK